MHRHTARAIVMNSKGQLLVMERRKQGKHYFVLPGGHVDAGEAPSEAAQREVLEETGLTVRAEKLLYKDIDMFGNRQQLFLCVYLGGEPALQPGSEEAALTDQLYKPQWMSLEQVAKVTFYPEWFVREFAADRQQGFGKNPRVI